MDSNNYRIEELQPGLFAIDDIKENSMYLIVGEKKALLIDTAMMESDIMPMLRTLTDKPIELALTHAHIDHMYHSDEFETVYLNEEDIKAWKWIYKYLIWAGSRTYEVKFKRINIKRFIAINENTAIDLGGNIIKVIHAKGHTPGSSVFVDEKHKALFTGDSIGSGVGVWLWMPGCSRLSDYRDNLEILLRKLEPYKDYTFLGGHRLQCVRKSYEFYAHPLTYKVVEDMYALSSKILNKEIKPRRHKFSLLKGKHLYFNLYIYDYGHASIWERRIKTR